MDSCDTPDRYRPSRAGGGQAGRHGPEELGVLLGGSGAERVAVIQGNLVTCRLQGIDPYTYLVDVLQRVGQDPGKDMIEPTPRLWKEKLGADPMKSDPGRVRDTQNVYT